jgi:hypothetical protein
VRRAGFLIKHDGLEFRPLHFMTLGRGVLGLGAGEGMELALMPIVENWVGIWRVMVKFAFKVGYFFVVF